MASLNVRDRSRSPRFPSYPLGAAVEFAQRIYEGVHRSPIDAATAFKLMGFSGRSGASSTALGAVRQFGLIDGTGDKTRISELGLQILEPASGLERTEAMAKCLVEPEVYRAIYARFNERIPPLDEPIRAFLIRDLGFSKGGADDCIKSLRETLTYLGGDPREISQTAVIRDEIDQPVSKPQASTQADLPSDKKGETFRIPLAKDCVAELTFIGTISSQGLAKLQSYIELMSDVWTQAD